MSKKHKKIITTTNYLENLVILTSTVTGFVYVLAFAALAGVLVGIASSPVGIKICAITAWIKNISQYLRKRKIIMIR